MSKEKLGVFFSSDVLATRAPDGLFDRPPSALLEHQTFFAECPERIENIKSVMERGPSADLFDWHDGRHASDEEILTFHTESYLSSLKKWSEKGHWATGTTFMPEGGMKTVSAGAGTTLLALDNIINGSFDKTYALVRPPAHHAAPDVADGYCFINAVGMAAIRAIANGYKRVAVIDWDVHHGNGTQEGLYDRDDILFVSLHMDHGSWGNSHPQTGGAEETGRGIGQGYNLNIPLPMGSGDDTYTQALNRIVVPQLEKFAPDLIIVSNGHDANQFDPNGRQLITMAGFHKMGSILKCAADSLCQGKLLAVQEGGYNVAYVGFCAYASLLGLMGKDLDLDDPLALYPPDGPKAKLVIDDLIKQHPLLS